LKIVMPDKLRARLDAASEKSGESVAEEIRIRVALSFGWDAIDPRTLRLMQTVLSLADLVKAQTGRHWHEDPRANRILLKALDARLRRMTKGDDSHRFADDELPVPSKRPVLSEDQRDWGYALEAIEWNDVERDRYSEELERTRKEW